MSDRDRVESAYYRYMGYDEAHSTEGLRHYVGLFPDGPVLELAPGRGEFLTLLQEAGTEAYGVDLDPGMVERACARGLDVRLGDAVAALREVPAGTLGGVFSAHFVEHLPPETVQDVVTEAARALRPGGVFVAATPNAASLAVMGYDFWRDPTHLRFYEERLLAFFCAQAGLEVVEHGTNPRNAPGPPPPTWAHEVAVDPALDGELAAAVRLLAADRKGRVAGDSPYLQLGHVLGVLAQRLQHTQEQLRDLREAHAQLLAQLYPGNEVYVVARRA